MNQTATANLGITFPLSKKDILFRLFNQGHITFDELWTLAEGTVVNNYLPQPPIPIYPLYPPYQPPIVYGVTASANPPSIH